MDVHQVRADLTAVYETAEAPFDGVSAAEQLTDYQSRVGLRFHEEVVLPIPLATPWGGAIIGSAQMLAVNNRKAGS